MSIPIRGTGPRRFDRSRMAYQSVEDADPGVVEYDHIIGFDEHGSPISERRLIRVQTIPAKDAD